MGDETCDLVTELLGRNLGNLVADSLVGVEIKRETCVVLLNDFTCNTLHRLGSDSTLSSKARRRVR